MLVEVLLGLCSILCALYLYLRRCYGYWKNKGVTFIEPRFPFGIAQDIFLGKSDVGTLLQKWYIQYKKQGLKYVGAFVGQQPSLIIFDLELCKHVLSKDFNHFVSRNDAPNANELYFKHLFNLERQEWKSMRTKLTPTFTSGKMKGMFPLMEKCAEQLQEHIDGVLLKKGQFEVKDLIARFTTDVIATCAFGLDVNSIKDRDHVFFEIGQLIFIPTRTSFFKLALIRYCPIIYNFLNISIYNPRISEFLTKSIKDTIEYRKEKDITRNDFVDLLIKVKENKSLDDNEDKLPSTGSRNRKHDTDLPDALTLEQMTAQAFVFFAAGFETAASTTSFCLYELAKNPDVQETLCREIDEVLANHGGHISYQALQEMTYMDKVMNETLRMYVSLPFLFRVCTETYQVPGTDLVIDEGVRVIIPTYAFHHDPDIYPDPYKFDPDRFSEENSKDRHHYAFLPYGEGPRICIGMRFSRIQVKIGLAAILSRYRLSTAPDTPSKLEIHPFAIITIPKHPFSLKITKSANL